MKPEWKRYLEDAGAELVDGRVESFGNAERERQVATTGDVFCDLSHHGLIAVHGADAQQFLHSQLTQDVEGLGEGESRLAAYCNAKGRIYAVFRLLRHGETYYLHLPRGQVETLLQRLRLFVLRADATLEDASEAWVRLGCSGPGVADTLREHLGGAPERVGDVEQAGDTLVIRVPAATHPRFELFTSLDGAKRLWSALNVRGAPVGADAWGLLGIMAGLPAIYPETSEAFVPQMVNLELIGGVSFNKGCYPGQEVVARMHYLGKPKRRMFHAWTDAPQRPAPGTDIAPAAGGERVGTAVDARPAPDGGFALLTVLATAATGQDLRVGDPAGPALELRELPYPLETTSESASNES